MNNFLVEPIRNTGAHHFFCIYAVQDNNPQKYLQIVSSNPSWILLCGSFGYSKYIWNRLHKTYIEEELYFMIISATPLVLLLLVGKKMADDTDVESIAHAHHYVTWGKKIAFWFILQRINFPVFCCFITWFLPSLVPINHP